MAGRLLQVMTEDEAKRLLISLAGGTETMKTLLLPVVCIVFVAAGCHHSAHPDKCSVTYQSYMPVALPIYDGHVETVVGHPGRIPELCTIMRQLKDSPHEQARFFNEIRCELTGQLKHEDYALIGWLGAVGNEKCNFVQLEEALAARAKRWGGDVVLIYSTRLQSHPPFAYILSCDERLRFYGNTDYPVFTPSQVHAGIARYPQAEAFVLRSCAGIDDQIMRILQLTPDATDRLEIQWRTAEAEAAHGQDCTDAWKWRHQNADIRQVGGEVPLPRRTLLTDPSATWSKFAQRRGPWKREKRADIDERLIIQDLVVRSLATDAPRTDQWGRFWRAERASEVVE